MRAPAFWWRESSIMARLLAPAADFYAGIATKRLAQPGIEADIPVVCVGNLTVGGAGKTPAALAIARILIASRELPWFLSRGYGGRRAGPVTVDPARHAARDVGDEPLLLARVAPTVVSRDRPAGALHAQKGGAGVIIMDDGFQNPSLNKQLSVLMIDGRRGIGNGCVFPAGPLRAPLDIQLPRAQAMIVVGDIAGAAPVIAAAKSHGVVVFYGRLEPDPDAVAALKGREVLAFAGIGDPDKFFATLGEAGILVRSWRGFPDHYRYRRVDGSALIFEAGQKGLTLVTTEKDMVRMRADPRLGELTTRTRVLPVSLVVYREKEFESFLLAALRSKTDIAERLAIDQPADRVSASANASSP